MAESRVILFGYTVDYQLRYHDGLLERLAESGWQVHVASADGPHLRAAGRLQGVSAHPLSLKRAPSVLNDILGAIALVRLLRQLRPDVTVFGTPKAGLLGNLAAWLTRVPRRVYELHGLRLEGATGLKRRVLTWFERRSCAFATEVVAVGRSLMQRAVESGAVAGWKITVVGEGSPNGVDVEHYARARADVEARQRLRKLHSIPDDAPVVVYVGRMASDKGVDLLLHAALMLPSIHVLLVGPADDGLGSSADSAFEALGARVHVTGEVEDAAPYLAVSDAFCLPSIREGLPTVVLEAFAAGVPVVATRATGIVDLIMDGSTGRLVTDRTPQALAEGLADAIAPRGACDVWVANARRLVNAHFDRTYVQGNWLDHLATRDRGLHRRGLKAGRP